MSTIRVRPEVLAVSRLSHSQLVLPGGRVDTSLAQVTVGEAESRSWRVTLSRPERADSRPPNINSLFQGAMFGYAAGADNNPASPPVRTNPIGVNGTDDDPIFVQMAWGQGNAQANRLLAHWPMLGGSVIVHGSSVAVWGGTFLLGNPAAEMPILQAQIAPDDGAMDACELSLQQAESITVGYAAPGDPAVVYVPDFARSVRVILVDATTRRVFDTGHPRCNLEWFDDEVCIEAWQQGSSIDVAPEWQKVPARGVMLRIGTPGANLDCGEATFTSCTALVHWRIAP